jgi:hypothetical protein
MDAVDERTFARKMAEAAGSSSSARKSSRISFTSSTTFVAFSRFLAGG